MNLTGKWIGQYTYGEGYSPEMKGESEPFEIDIVDNDGNLTGPCIDNVVKAKPGNESYINGFLRGRQIEFKKRYRYHLDVDGKDMENEPGQKSDGVDYTGRLKKTLFSRRYYFKGKWSITIEYLDENNNKAIFTCMGKWKMTKEG